MEGNKKKVQFRKRGISRRGKYLLFLIPVDYQREIETWGLKRRYDVTLELVAEPEGVKRLACYWNYGKKRQLWRG